VTDLTNPPLTPRDSTIIGRYRLDLFADTGPFAGLFTVEVYRDGRMVRGPFRYAWPNQAAELRDNLAITLRAKVQQEGGAP
jgi:hypothetical protein